MSYSLLAAKCHQSRRTAIRHVQRLIDLGIIGVQRFWGPNKKWSINKYYFFIKWQKPAQMGKRGEPLGNSDILTPTLPTQEEREKYGTLANLEKGREMVLSWLTPRSALWQLANS